MLLFLCFLCLEQIKLSFEINRLNTNQQNLYIEYEDFKDRNIKLLTQFYSNNSPATIEKEAIETLGMVKKKTKTTRKKNRKRMKTKIISEIGWNHMGDIALAEEMVMKAASSGANIVKFQYWDPQFLKPGVWDTDGRREIYNKEKTKWMKKE